MTARRTDSPLEGDAAIQRRHHEAVEQRARGYPPPNPEDRQDVLDWVEDWALELREHAAQGYPMWLHIPNVEMLDAIIAMLRDAPIAKGRRRRRTSYKEYCNIHDATWWGVMRKKELEAASMNPADALAQAAEEASDFLWQQYHLESEVSTMERKIKTMAATYADILEHRHG
jgi:hypothetical protein